MAHYVTNGSRTLRFDKLDAAQDFAQSQNGGGDRFQVLSSDAVGKYLGPQPGAPSQTGQQIRQLQNKFGD